MATLRPLFASVDDPDRDAGRPGVDPDHAAEPVDREWQLEAVHRDRHLQRRVDPEPDGRGHVGVRDDRGGDDLERRPGSQGLASTGLMTTTGTSVISASLNGITGSTLLTVTAATLVSIAVTPPNPSIAKGSSEPFIATGTYSDTSTQNLTTAVTWASATPTVATISNVSGSEGIASTGLTTTTGTSVISATLSGVSGSTLLTVTAATLVSIAVTPPNPSIAKGSSVSFIATATYSDTSTQDVTQAVTWSSATTSVATISNATGSQGVAATGLMTTTGTSVISATLTGITGSTLLTVTAATLTQIQVTPPNPSIAKGSSVSFLATGIYSDTSTEDVTTAVTWSSATTTVATISNAAGSPGSGIDRPVDGDGHERHPRRR